MILEQNFKVLEDFKAKAEAKKSGKEYQQSVTIKLSPMNASNHY
jgi:hypothetical protein